ncbi:MAG: hypothetical protein WBH77_00755 [Saccharofermentanales bacterium]
MGFSMIFSEILNILLNLSNTSIQEFADAILYDRSYISKWVNDRALPSAGSWQDTKANMINFLDNKLTVNDTEYLAIQYPYIQAIVQNNKIQSKTELIDTLLEKSYTQTSHRDEVRRQDTGKCSAITITGVQDVVNYLINYLTQNLHDLTHYATFYYTGNLVRCFNNKLLDNIYINYISPNSFRVKSTVNMDLLINDKQEDLQYINSYLRLISSLPFLNLEIYEATRNSDSVVRMVHQGDMAGWGFDLNNEVPEILFVIENKEKIDESYLSLKTFFAGKNPIIALQERFVEGLKDIADKPPANTPILYTPRLYLYYGSDKLRERMFKDRFINKQEYELWGKIRTVLTGPELSQMKVIITKSSFNDTFVRGWIYKTNGSIQIFGDYYKKYIEDLFMMFKRKNIIILDDDKISNVHRLPMSVVYSDQTTSVVLQFNQMTPYETRNILYESKNQAFTHLIYDWLKAVMNIENENFLKQ